MSKLKISNQRGVTLIALVVTIIILIILAVISVNALFGEDGVITAAQSSKIEHKQGEIYEAVRLVIMEKEVERIALGDDYDLYEIEEILYKKGIATEVDYVNVDDFIDNQAKQLTVETQLEQTLTMIEYEDKIKVVITKQSNKGTGIQVGLEGKEPTYVVTPNESITGSNGSNNNDSEDIELNIENIKEIIMTESTDVEDTLGNTVLIPKDFKVASDSGSSIEEGIVIEDEKGNQFVWIPVGEVQTSSGETKTINLSRYTFNSSTGVPTAIEKTTADNDCTETTSNSATTKLTTFEASAINYGGYYLGRYEAGGSAGNLTVKAGQTVYDFISRNDAVAQSQAIYSNNEYYESDLLNSLALDTAIVYIQTFGTNSKYSIQTTLSTVYSTTGAANDIQLKINDMTSNAIEWTTEYSSFRSSATAVTRGGYYGGNHSSFSLYYRRYNDGKGSSGVGFRPILFIAL